MADDPRPETTEEQEGTNNEPEGDFFTLKVDGEERKIPRDEVIKLAQKGMSADQRFQEAARLREEVKQEQEGQTQALALAGAVQSLKNNPTDEGALRIFYGALGLDREQIDVLIKEVQAAPEPASGKQSGRQTPAQAAVPERKGPVTFEELDPELQRELRQVARTRIEEDLKTTLDRDKFLGDIYKGGGKAADTLLKLLRTEVQRRVVVGVEDSSGQLRRQEFGPQVVEQALQVVRQTAEDLGIHSARDQSPPGVGRVAAGTRSHHPTEKPKRVPITDPKYDEYFEQRLAWEAMRAEGK